MTATTSVDTASFRLPHDVVPKRYALTLSPDLAAARFEGEERVEVEVRQATRTVVLNAVELEIHEATIAREGQQPLTAQVALDEETARATLTFPQQLEPGDWTLSIRFTGTLNDKLHGFYRSTYRTEQGEERTLATTQFESTDARRAFPCWDEPAFKAVFAVTLIVDQGLVAIGNAAVQSDTVDQATGKRTVVFAETMPMSTYLVAFIVGEFESSPVADVEGTPVRVWSPPGKRDLTAYALRFAEHALRYFNTYYGIKYPGGKLDLLAIPDFASGAMENLGAITFRERLLLLDEKTATHGEQESVAAVEAHEIAHMWFGDLVTMQWWNGLWLKEAFASFMELLAVDAFKPEWDVWTSFGIDRAGALIVDGLHSTRPIEYTVVKPEDAAGMYDVLTYQKGAAVLRMLEQFLSPELFRRGINEYLRRHSYANAETSDLWDALEDTSEEPVRRVMDSWIFQPGYPLVTADYRDGKLVLSQERFLYRRQPGEASDQSWQVPVVVWFDGGAELSTPSVKLLLSERETQVDVPQGFRSLTVNAGGSGVYRVRYTQHLLAALLRDVQNTLSPIERFNLVNDAWANVQAGYTRLTDYLDMTQLFAAEMDRNVWAILLSSFGAVRRITALGQRPKLEALVRARLDTAYSRLGWEPQNDETDLVRELRGQILSAAGTLGNDRDVQERAREIYRRWSENPESVDPEVAAACVGIVAAAGGREEYAEYWRRFREARNPQEERRFLGALAFFRGREEIEQTLAHALDGSIRTQDAPFTVGGLFYNSEAGEMTWRFVTEHWDEMLQKYPDNTIIRMVEGVTALSTPELATEVEQFFQTHRVPDAGLRLNQTLERMRIAVDFRARESEHLRAYLGE
jgi:puromycin-sensitive aminopeptidase